MPNKIYDNKREIQSPPNIVHIKYNTFTVSLLIIAIYIQFDQSLSQSGTFVFLQEIIHFIIYAPGVRKFIKFGKTYSAQVYKIPNYPDCLL